MYLNKKSPVVEHVIIEIPTVRDNTESFFRLWKELFDRQWNKSNKYYIELRFSDCNYAGVNTTAIIGAFVHYIKSFSDFVLRIETKTMKTQVHIKLRNMGLLESLDREDGKGFAKANEDIIPFREFLPETNESDILFYLKGEWLSKNRIHFTEDVESEVLSSLWEIYANAFEHSSTEIVVSCGSYDKKTQVLSILVGDSGHGIPESIRRYKGEKLESQDALKWALIKGHSTYTANLKVLGKKEPRGLGLALLSELADVTGGTMEIYTEDIIYRRYQKTCNYVDAPSKVKGSWLKLSLKCDQNIIYSFKNENIPSYIV